MPIVVQLGSSEDAVAPPRPPASSVAVLVVIGVLVVERGAEHLVLDQRGCDRAGVRRVLHHLEGEQPAEDQRRRQQQRAAAAWPDEVRHQPHEGGEPEDRLDRERRHVRLVEREEVGEQGHAEHHGGDPRRGRRGLARELHQQVPGDDHQEEEDAGRGRAGIAAVVDLRVAGDGEQAAHRQRHPAPASATHSAVRPAAPAVRPCVRGFRRRSLPSATFGRRVTPARHRGRREAPPQRGLVRSCSGAARSERRPPGGGGGRRATGGGGGVEPPAAAGRRAAEADGSLGLLRLWKPPTATGWRRAARPTGPTCGRGRPGSRRRPSDEPMMTRSTSSTATTAPKKMAWFQAIGRSGSFVVETGATHERDGDHGDQDDQQRKNAGQRQRCQSPSSGLMVNV